MSRDTGRVSSSFTCRWEAAPFEEARSMGSSSGGPAATSVQANCRARNCAGSMSKSGVCPVCGWRRGRDTTPRGQLPDGRPDYPPENPSGWLRACEFSAIGLGLLLLVIGAGGGSAGLAVFGLFGALFGVTSIIVTKNGHIWNGLWPEQKVAASPGIVFGGSVFAVVLVYIGLMALVGSIFAGSGTGSGKGK